MQALVDLLGEGEAVKLTVGVGRRVAEVQAVGQAEDVGLEVEEEVGDAVPEAVEELLPVLLAVTVSATRRRRGGSGAADKGGGEGRKHE